MRSIILIFLLCPLTLFGQELKALHQELSDLDSLIFERGFNNCDTMGIPALIPENFEFYHDQSGITDDRESFLQTFKTLCSMQYKPLRKLVKGSMKVYPLYDNGKLYGAIQEGVHEFYAIEGEKQPYLTSTARFTHLWILNADNWQLKRVLSYDHRTPD